MAKVVIYLPADLRILPLHDKIVYNRNFDNKIELHIDDYSVADKVLDALYESGVKQVKMWILDEKIELPTMFARKIVWKMKQSAEKEREIEEMKEAFIKEKKKLNDEIKRLHEELVKEREEKEKERERIGKIIRALVHIDNGKSELVRKIAEELVQIDVDEKASEIYNELMDLAYLQQEDDP